MLAWGHAAAQVPPPEVPQNLRTPATETVLLKAQGRGKQIYACKAAGAGHFEWTLERPQAELLNDHGQVIGKHYEGPTWEASDGSKVTGQVEQRANAPRAGAVPWLLLKAKSTQGSGTFSRVNYIQRVATQGGAAPTEGCDSSHPGAEMSIEYSADYYFYIPHP